MSETKLQKVGGKTIVEWIESIEILPGGITKDQFQLEGVVGIYLAELNGEVRVIGVGTAFDNGGLRKRLKTIAAKDQSGNNHSSARFMKKYKNEIIFKILSFGRGAGNEKIARRVAKLLRKHYQVRPITPFD